VKTFTAIENKVYQVYKIPSLLDYYRQGKCCSQKIIQVYKQMYIKFNAP